MKRTMLRLMNASILLFLVLILLMSAHLNPVFPQANETGTQKEDTNVDEKLEAKTITPPIAKRIKKELTLHGHTREDYYYWLNQRENPDVINYLKAENHYLQTMMKPVEKLEETLFNEIIARIAKDDSTVPYLANGYYYYIRYEKGKEYPIHCRKKGKLEAKEEIILDSNITAKNCSYYHATGLNVSPNNKILAYGEDTVSRRKYVIRFKNLETGELLPDKIRNTTGFAVWANDNKTIFYTSQDKALRSFKIFKHRLNELQDKDTEVYHEKDETFRTLVFKTKSRKFIMIANSSTMSDEYLFLDANRPDGKFTVIEPRQRGHEYMADHFGDHFYIVTNHQAKNFKIVKTPVEKPGKENWQDVIPHRDDVLMEGIEIFKDYLALTERKNGLVQLRIIPWNSNNDHYIAFDEETYVAEMRNNEEYDTSLLRFEYSSLTTPSTWYDYDMKQQVKKLLKQEVVVGDFSPGNYHAERLYATAADGVKIPISLVYRKGIEKNGDNPLLLSAYGSYGFSIDPFFMSSRLSLLDRGCIFAIAHIRGGSEMGRYWYEDGKLLKKKNTFTDFISCTEHLIQKKYTNPQKLFALGGSAGGLLMGVVANMRPDLYKGIVAAVPFVDIVTTMLDESIPLTTVEYDEWGNPTQKEYYDYMLSYSPYDNVEAKNYPAILVTTGLHDSQVQYWEPAKWVAKLRYMKTDNHLLLLHTDLEAGHGGASGRFKRHKETARYFAFILYLAGITR